MLPADPGAAQNATISQVSVATPETLARVLDDDATPPDPANRAPVITWTARSLVTVGNTYFFVPTASDPDGDTLTFSIVNRPN